MRSAAVSPLSSPRLVTSQDNLSPLARRLAVIDRYRVLDTPREANFDDITALAATLCNTPFAAISFVAEQRQWFKAEIGLGVRETPISQSFCAYAIKQEDVYIVTDASVDTLFADNPLVTEHPHLRFYAGMPLVAKDGTAFATLCVLDNVARPEGLNGHQRETLRVLAQQVETQLELRRSIVERDLHVAEQSEMSERLHWMAGHDALTGLANRTLFQIRLSEALEDARRDDGSFALLMIDIDHFKQVNEVLGHDGGDRLLGAVADRLSSCAGDGDTVARLGGDEFGIIMSGVGIGLPLEARIGRVLSRLREPVEIAARAFDCRASVGIAIAPDHGLEAEVLVRSTDLALNAAKLAGRDQAVVFRPSMLAAREQQQSMLKLAREAIERDEIAPYYQPKVDLLTGVVRGFEALLRWESSGDVLLPSMIDPAFADRDLSMAISDRMLDRVLRDMANWIADGIDFGHIAINSCAADFAGNDFAERLLAAIAKAEVPPSMLQVEVTESVFLGRGSFYVERALAVLSRAGVRVALDDFGTGYASLTHLKQFTIDVLKIDRSFVAGIERDAGDAAIVRAVIGLGNSLGIETVAEGIETQAQADYVRDSGCVLGQGFLFGAALPASDIPERVRHRK